MLSMPPEKKYCSSKLHMHIFSSSLMGKYIFCYFSVNGWTVNFLTHFFCKFNISSDENTVSLWQIKFLENVAFWYMKFGKTI